MKRLREEGGEGGRKAPLLTTQPEEFIISQSLYIISHLSSFLLVLCILCQPSTAASTWPSLLCAQHPPKGSRFCVMLINITLFSWWDTDVVAGSSALGWAEDGTVVREYTKCGWMDGRPRTAPRARVALDGGQSSATPTSALHSWGSRSCRATEPIFTLVGSRMLRKDRLLKSGRSLLATRRRRRRLYNFLVIISSSLVVGGSLFTLVHLSWQKMLSRSWHHPSSLQHILMLDTNPFLSWIFGFFGFLLFLFALNSTLILHYLFYNKTESGRRPSKAPSKH